MKFRDENPTHRSLNNVKLLVGKWVENGRLLPPFPKGLSFSAANSLAEHFFAFSGDRIKQKTDPESNASQPR